MVEDWRRGGFGLYLHWPFCESKCPYCDFNSHVAQGIRYDRWQAAFVAEIGRAGLETSGRILQTVYFGGGTPSLMAPDLVAAILDMVRRTWRIANDLEVTLEANPGSVETGKFRAFRDAGITRVSLGVQAMNDHDLRLLGRRHTVAEALRALDVARTNFDRVSFDLIYARQDQTLADWKKELTAALLLSAGHLSLYQLTVEPGTTFARRHEIGGLLGLPHDDLSADMFEMTQDLCAAADHSAYEVSNHCRPGEESRHNLIYWRSGDYIGIGPGAHGRLSLRDQRWATEHRRDPTAWLTQMEAGESPEVTRQLLDKDERGLEFLLMGLRLQEGIDCRRYASLTGAALPQEAVDELMDLGLVSLVEQRLAATPKGRILLNSVIRKLAGA